jgi:hypothetical protein
MNSSRSTARSIALTIARVTMVAAVATAGMLATTVSATSAPTDGDLTRCAELELRVAGLFRVGTALLYLNECEDVRRILEAVPKKFSLELARSFRGADLIQTARSTLKQNLAISDVEELPDVLGCLADAYVDADSGDRYDVVFRPESGLSMYLNGSLLRHCDGSEGAEKYFMIWFGEQPFHRRMRDRLIEEALSNGAASS